MAVLRLKLIRNAGRELTEEEESKLPGCNWAMNCQSAAYCFFKYAAEYLQDTSLSDIEIARMLNVSVDTLKKIEKSALAKVKDSDMMCEMEEYFGDSGVIDHSRDEDADHGCIL
jgi:DNA-directed RNA polymerase sigma subunit (sigma70/sigma32)